MKPTVSPEHMCRLALEEMIVMMGGSKNLLQSLDKNKETLRDIYRDRSKRLDEDGHYMESEYLMSPQFMEWSKTRLGWDGAEAAVNLSFDAGIELGGGKEYFLKQLNKKFPSMSAYLQFVADTQTDDFTEEERAYIRSEKFLSYIKEKLGDAAWNGTKTQR
jgi:hypothetical protein